MGFFFCLSKRTCWIKNYIHSMVWIDWILRTQPMFMQISSNVRDSKKLFCSKMICNAIVFTWQNCFSMHSKVGFNTEHWIFIYFFSKKAPITYCYSSCFNLEVSNASCDYIEEKRVMLNLNLDGYYWKKMDPGYGWIETLQCVAFPKDDALSFPWCNLCSLYITQKIREITVYMFWLHDLSSFDKRLVFFLNVC